MSVFFLKCVEMAWPIRGQEMVGIHRRKAKNSLQWCHNDCHSISNHWQLDCVFNHLFRQTSKSLCYLPFVKKINRWLMDSPHKGQVTQEAVSWHDVIMNVSVPSLNQSLVCLEMSGSWELSGEFQWKMNKSSSCVYVYILYNVSWWMHPPNLKSIPWTVHPEIFRNCLTN